MPRDEAATEQVALDQPLDITGTAYRRWAAVFGLFAVVLLVIMGIPALTDAVTPVDEWFWELAVNNEYPPLVAGAEAVALLGGTVAVVAVGTVGAVVLAWQRRWMSFAIWVFAINAMTAVNIAIKALYGRSRPPMGLEESSTGSFASGHVLMATTLVLLIALTWVPAGRRRRSLLVAGAIYVVLVAASRMYLRVHWFTDVIAGLAIGVSSILALLLLAGWWLARSEERRSE